MKVPEGLKVENPPYSSEDDVFMVWNTVRFHDKPEKNYRELDRESVYASLESFFEDLGEEVDLENIRCRYYYEDNMGYWYEIELLNLDWHTLGTVDLKFELFPTELKK